MWIVALLSAGAAHAGPGEAGVRNVVERADNQTDQRDDRRDAAVLIDLVRDWNAAIASRNHAAALDADLRIFAWLDREIAESRREVVEAEREAAASSRELRGSRRQRTAQGGAANRYATRDDRRDRADDRVDAAQARIDLEQTEAIDAKLKSLQPAFRLARATPAEVQQKRALLDQLVVMARRELAEGQEEMIEDRGETREDRRTRLR